MSIRFHAGIVAISIAATGAVSYASVPTYKDALTEEASMVAERKSDRLTTPAAHGTSYVIIQTQGEGVTIVSRIRVDDGSFERASPVGKERPGRTFASTLADVSEI